MPIQNFKYEKIFLKEDYEGKVEATLIRSEKNEIGRIPALYLHGFVDYFFHPHLADEFHLKGFNFFALELRKYGHSTLPHQHPNYCRNIEEYFEEIDLALEQIYGESGRKIIFLGHSTGGLIAPLYAEKGNKKELIQAIVLNSPFLDLNEPAIVKAIGVPILGAFSKLFPYANIPKALDPIYAMSVHKDHTGEWDFDTNYKPIEGFPAYFAWLNAIKNGQDIIKKGLNLEIPVLLMYASHSFKPKKWSKWVQKSDIVLNVEHMIKYGPRLGSDVTLVEIQDGMHDLFLSSESARNEAFKEMFNWINKHVIL
jgi:alpha-beta hydrolase superfamily lysophospholipase